MWSVFGLLWQSYVHITYICGKDFESTKGFLNALPDSVDAVIVCPPGVTAVQMQDQYGMQCGEAAGALSSVWKRTTMDASMGYDAYLIIDGSLVAGPLVPPGVNWVEPLSALLTHDVDLIGIEAVRAHGRVSLMPGVLMTDEGGLQAIQGLDDPGLTWGELSTFFVDAGAHVSALHPAQRSVDWTLPSSAQKLEVSQDPAALFAPITRRRRHLRSRASGAYSVSNKLIIVAESAGNVTDIKNYFANLLSVDASEITVELLNNADGTVTIVVLLGAGSNLLSVQSGALTSSPPPPSVIGSISTFALTSGDSTRISEGTAVVKRECAGEGASVNASGLCQLVHGVWLKAECSPSAVLSAVAFTADGCATAPLTDSTGRCSQTLALNYSIACDKAPAVIVAAWGVDEDSALTTQETLFIFFLSSLCMFCVSLSAWYSHLVTFSPNKYSGRGATAASCTNCLVFMLCVGIVLNQSDTKWHSGLAVVMMLIFLGNAIAMPLVARYLPARWGGSKPAHAGRGDVGREGKEDNGARGTPDELAQSDDEETFDEDSDADAEETSA